MLSEAYTSIEALLRRQTHNKERVLYEPALPSLKAGRMEGHLKDSGFFSIFLQISSESLTPVLSAKQKTKTVAQEK